MKFLDPEPVKRYIDPKGHLLDEIRSALTALPDGKCLPIQVATAEEAVWLRQACRFMGVEGQPWLGEFGQRVEMLESDDARTFYLRWDPRR